MRTAPPARGASAALLLALLGGIAWGCGPAPRRVWLDVDPAVMRGGSEPDDGVAMVQAFHSPEIEVVGVSVVFGNAPVEVGFPIARQIAARFGPPGLAVHRGAAGPFGELTDASRALIGALEREPLTVFVLGPATNLAAALQMRPDLAGRIEAVILVIGRRPGEALTFPGSPERYPDFNFELDPAAAEVVLDSGAPIVLAPFEFAVQAPVTAEDWATLEGTPFLDLFGGPIEDYLDWFEAETGRRATYPFDSFAVASVTAPDLLDCDRTTVAIREGPADTEWDSGETKPWLVRPAPGEPPPSDGWPVTWCHTPAPGLTGDLLRRLGSRR